MPPLFPAAEYDDRLRRTRERMADAGLDAVVVTDPANMNYLTGYDGWSFYTPQGVLVALEGHVVLFTREMDANGARLTTSLPDDDILGFPEELVQRPDRHPMEWVAERLRERGLARGRVGLELDSYYFSPRGYLALRDGLAGTDLVDANELVNWVRAVKSPAEIEMMTAAARIMERVMAVAVEAVEPGVRQCDAVARILDAQARGTEDAGGEYTAVVHAPHRDRDVDAAPHLERRAVPSRGGDRAGARGLPRALPLPDGADGLPRRAAAQAGGRGGGRRGGARDGAGRGRAGRDL